ncbi:uncharacterized protein MAM_00649 [Metarhizium album ARSEF 1941]|uniref:Uncharacterized protein n=1 Tax=Metarhizium album (strain ARSEF 1941) TaxID=1081103 RepID=A0A0B2X7A8_METAS|nr:uncharacterized protein MAM_00649 [Metarhizium album ARSEF 1941]KHO01648.1 hypothetical protein MAM_00649 [Metarhizium album ARSEF 1941]
MPEGKQSPPPERQTGKQLHDPPAKGTGLEQVDDKGDKMKAELENLPSNPKAPMDEHLEEKFSKETGNPVGARIQK